MTEEKFAEEIAARHHTIKAPVLLDIRSLIRNLTDAERADLYGLYLDNWKASYPPVVGNFKEWMDSTGKKISARPAGVMYAASVCANCGTRYSLRSQGCPRCGSGDVKNVTDAAHPAMVSVQADCWQCGVYHDDGGGKFGPECDAYAAGTMPFEYCRDCRCRQCCSYERAFRADPASVHGRETPWIDFKYWARMRNENNPR